MALLSGANVDKCAGGLAAQRMRALGSPRLPGAANGIGMVTPQGQTALHSVQKCLPYEPEFGLILPVAVAGASVPPQNQAHGCNSPEDVWALGSKPPSYLQVSLLSTWG